MCGGVQVCVVGCRFAWWGAGLHGGVQVCTVGCRHARVEVQQQWRARVRAVAVACESACKCSARVWGVGRQQQASMWCYNIFLISTYRPYLLLSILYLDIGHAPYFLYTAIAEPLSLLSLDVPPPVFLPIQYILPTICIPLWYASLALHSSLHSQCTVSPQHCTVNAQSIAQLLRLRLTAQPPLLVVYKSSLLYDQSPDLVFSYFSQYRTLNPFSIPSLPLRSIVH